MLITIFCNHGGVLNSLCFVCLPHNGLVLIQMQWCGECLEAGGSFEVEESDVCNEVASIVKSTANTK